MEELKIRVDDERSVSGLLQLNEADDVLLVFGHGAGADMRHSSMQSIADAFGTLGISTLRYNFPFKEEGRNRVDRQPVSTATVAAAHALGVEVAPGPLLLGGHSFGGRMATHAVVDRGLDVAAMIFGSFPLHNPKKPSIARAEHLDDIAAPMLFLSGSRDGMASVDLMTEVTSRIGATLHWLDTADHGYKVLKRSRRRSDDVFTEMATTARGWLDGIL